ncbi:SLC13 family permease [Halopenitus persicus]|uniref:SLC13 family permease n=1 Tax=Halopenitus persicus TaxID=1048396 RepID=UPI000BBAEA62|nr:SLC13 family permease [Halopenitus persicus]
MPADDGGSFSPPTRLERVLSVEGIGVGLAAAILVAGTWLVSVPGLSAESQTVLTVFGVALALWLSKAIPYTISSVLVVTLLFALGAVDSFETAVGGFASTLVFFLFLLLLLGQTISSVGLDERAAQRLLSAQSTPKGTVRSLAANIFTLSFLMPSAVARAVTFIPVVRRLTETYGLAEDSDFTRASYLVLGHVNPIASMALMTGGGMAIITSQVINADVRTITWVEWAIVMIPPVIVLYGLSTIAAARIYDVDDTITIDDKAATDGGEPTGEDEEKTADDVAGDPSAAGPSADDPVDDLAESVVDGTAEPLTRDQRIVGGVMGATVVAWILGSFLGVPTIVPAIGAVTALSLPGVRIITADDLADVSWGILFLIGAMFSILDVMETSGTLTLLVETITVYIPFAAMAPWQVVATLLLIAAVLRSFFSTASAAIIIVLPIVLEFAAFLGVNQLFLAFSVLIMIGSTTFLPFNTTSVLLSFDYGPLSNRDVLAFGLVTMVFGSLVIVASWLFYWPLVL